MTVAGLEIFVDPIVDFTAPIPGDRDGRSKGDALRIGGDYTPGVARVRKASEPRKWDKRAGYGASGATVVYMGDDLSEFDVDVTMWTQTQFNDWKAFKKKWLSKPARQPTLAANAVFVAQPKALGLEHPQLAHANITAAVLVDVTAPDLVDDTGLWGVTISFMQYRAPLPMLGRPDGATPGAKAPAPTAQDKTEKEIAKVLDMIKKANDNLARGGK